MWYHLDRGSEPACGKKGVLWRAGLATDVRTWGGRGTGSCGWLPSTGYWNLSGVRASLCGSRLLWGIIHWRCCPTSRGDLYHIYPVGFQNCCDPVNIASSILPFSEWECFSAFLSLLQYQWVWVCLGRLFVFLVHRSPNYKEPYLSLLEKTGRYLESLDFEPNVFTGWNFGLSSLGMGRVLSIKRKNSKQDIWWREELTLPQVG